MCPGSLTDTFLPYYKSLNELFGLLNRNATKNFSKILRCSALTKVCVSDEATGQITGPN